MLSAILAVLEAVPSDPAASAASGPALTHAVRKAVLHVAQLRLLDRRRYASTLDRALTDLGDGALTSLADAADAPDALGRVRALLLHEAAARPLEMPRWKAPLRNAQFALIAQRRGRPSWRRAMSLRSVECSVATQLVALLAELPLRPRPPRGCGRDDERLVVRATRRGRHGLARRAPPRRAPRMRVLLAFGGIDKRGGITPDLRLLELGLTRRGVDVAVAGSLHEVERRLRRGEGDVVHVFGCLPSATIFGGIACAHAARRPVVWTPVFHPGRLTYWNGSGLHRPMQLFDHLATRAARHVDAVVAATSEEAQLFARLGAPLVDVNPPVVEATAARLTGAARRRARATFDLGDEPVVLMIAAHSARRKGMGFARDAFIELRRRVPDARLLVVGGGSTEGLEDVAGTVVGGWCADEDLVGAYGSADVLFVPSRYEQFSRVTLEAWAHELPVVVSDGVALATVARERAGLVVPFGDAVGAAEALSAIVTDPGLAQHLGSAGRALAEDRFTLEGHVERMLELYGVLLTDAPCPGRATARARREDRGPHGEGPVGRSPASNGASSSDGIDRERRAAAYFAATGTVLSWWDPLGDRDPDQRRWLSAQLDGLLAVCPVEGRRVLDAATGRGRAAIACAGRGAAAVVALDISEDMLAAAKDAAVRAGVATEIEFRLADVGHPDPSLSGFDVAFLLEALLHLDDPAAVLRGLHDALAPGGSLVLTTNGANPIARLVQPPRRSGRAANQLQIATANLANQLLTPLFGFQWDRSRTMGALYRSIFNVPVRPLGPTLVRRMLEAAGFTELEHLAARHHLLVREHRWIARRAPAIPHRAAGSAC